MEEIKGYVEHIVYRNEDNGYTVFNLNNDDGDLTCVGKFHYIEEGELLELTGEYIVHKVYGTQLQVENSKVCQPEDKVSIERYLGSGAIKGVGPSLAGRIVKKFGGDTFRIIEEEPERLAEVKGISHSGRRKKRYEGSHDLSAKIWHFYDTGGKDLSALWSECLSRNRRKSISDGRSCAGSWI